MTETTTNPDNATVLGAANTNNTTANPEQESVDAAELGSKSQHGQTGQSDQDGGNGEAQAGDYTDFIVPEGITLNPELLGEFKAMAKGMKLNQEQAQQLTDLGVKLTERLAADQRQGVESQKNQWLQAARADNEFGGDKLAENLAVAARAMQVFATPELKAVLDKTGLGNHPDLIRAFVRAGKLISEDGLVAGGTQPAGGAGKSLADKLYPGQGR